MKADDMIMNSDMTDNSLLSNPDNLNSLSTPNDMPHFEAAELLGLTSVEVNMLNKFVSVGRHYDVVHSFVDVSRWNLPEIAILSGIHIAAINKGGNFSIAIWVEFLRIIGHYMPPERFKYRSVEEFVQKYECFSSYNIAELTNLMLTANWMNM